MLQFLFDTDHVTLFEQGHLPLRSHLTTRSAGEVGVSAVSVEEALRGRLAALSQARDGSARIRRYALLVGTVQILNQFPIVPFDQSSESQFQQLRAQKLRIGAQDLKIAAISLVYQLTVLTRNRRDFAGIPGIRIDDWSV